MRTLVAHTYEVWGNAGGMNLLPAWQTARKMRSGKAEDGDETTEVAVSGKQAVKSNEMDTERMHTGWHGIVVGMRCCPGQCASTEVRR